MGLLLIDVWEWKIHFNLWPLCFFPLNNSIFEDALQAAFSKKNWLAFRRYLARPPDSSARWGRWEGMTELDGA